MFYDVSWSNYWGEQRFGASAKVQEMHGTGKLTQQDIKAVAISWQKIERQSSPPPTPTQMP